MSRDSGPLAKGRLESLTGTMNDLFQKAVQNEEILRRYQQFELKLLDLTTFEAATFELFLNVRGSWIFNC